MQSLTQLKKKLSITEDLADHLITQYWDLERKQNKIFSRHVVESFFDEKEEYAIEKYNLMLSFYGKAFDKTKQQINKIQENIKMLEEKNDRIN